MNGLTAVQKLAEMGYRFRVDGNGLRYEWQGPGKPDPAQVRPLLETIKEHKGEVLIFLKCYCPRCGGVAFCPDLDGKERCLACDWEELARMYPGLAETKH